jgi:plastocyanin
VRLFGAFVRLSFTQARTPPSPSPAHPCPSLSLQTPKQRQNTAEALSREDYLNAPGQTYSVKLTEKGTYGIYCEPHRGAGMTGKIIVN